MFYNQKSKYMKKLILFLSAVIFLSACSNKIGLQKRRYNKGFYVSTSKDRVNPEINKHVKVAKLEAKKVAAINSGKLNQNELVLNSYSLDNSIQLTTTEVKQPIANSIQKLEVSKEHVKKGHAIAIAQSSKIKTQRLHNTREFKSIPNAMAKGGSTNLVVLVILSLFPILALIAMYLHDGKSITMNFWIDLILHFLLLYWLFALLVVLDVINLA